MNNRLEISASTKEFLRNEFYKRHPNSPFQLRALSVGICELRDTASQEFFRTSLKTHIFPPSKGSILQDLWELFLIFGWREAELVTVGVEICDPYEPFDCDYVIRSYKVDWQPMAIPEGAEPI